MNKVDLAGLKIDALKKSELLKELERRIQSGQKTWVTTPYSEFLYAALEDRQVMDMLNKSDFAVPDGIGLFWAAKYLSIPLTAKTYWGKIFQAIWQMKYSLWAVLFYPKWIKSAFPEKIPGSDLVWGLTNLAAKNNLSIYLLGGFGDTPKLAANKLISQSANKLKVSYSNKNPSDPTIIEDIKKAAPDLLFVAYGPIKQEAWIAQNLPNLSTKLTVGLGGTFDYLAGKVANPPRFLRRIGLEWLWRLFTQPHRIKRIFKATFGLVNKIVIEKISRQLPLRKNAVSVILNSQNQILLCRRNPNPKPGDAVGEQKQKFQNYWQIPQGGIEGSEKIIDGAYREVFEETGLKNLELIKISSRTNSYLFPLTWYRIFKTKWRFKGQIQNIIFFRFLGQDNQVKIDNSEFIDYKWANINQLENLIHAEKNKLTNIILEDLKELKEKAII